MEPRVEAGAARRQFMKLSLWVHPDKNAHPRAVDAFHAADMAYKAIKARLHTACEVVKLHWWSAVSAAWTPPTAQQNSTC